MSEETPLELLTDEQLAQRVQRSCRDSFVELDRRLRSRLLHLLSLRLGNRADAEDVTQQTFLKVFEKIDHYNPKQRFCPWVFTIALRLATDHQRRRRDQPVGAERGLVDVVDQEIGPEERATARERSVEFWAVVRRVLPPNQRTALWLFYGEEQSVREIAAVTRRTSVAVRVLLYRARKALIPHLQDDADRPPTTSPAVDSQASLQLVLEVKP